MTFLLSPIDVWQSIPSGSIPAIKRLNLPTWETGTVENLPSQCGLECTYNIRFAGPYLRCNNAMIERHLSDTGRTCNLTAFAVRAQSLSRPNDFTIFEKSRSLNKTSIINFTQEIEQIIREASQTDYDVTFSYAGGLRDITHSSTYKGSPAQTENYLYTAMGYLITRIQVVGRMPL